MKRRDFITLLGGAWPRGDRWAQQGWLPPVRTLMSQGSRRLTRSSRSCTAPTRFAAEAEKFRTRLLGERARSRQEDTS
jgi:hypothetical protein